MSARSEREGNSFQVEPILSEPERTERLKDILTRFGKAQVTVGLLGKFFDYCQDLADAYGFLDQQLLKQSNPQPSKLDLPLSELSTDEQMIPIDAAYVKNNQIDPSSLNKVYKMANFYETLLMFCERDLVDKDLLVDLGIHEQIKFFWSKMESVEWMADLLNQWKISEKYKKIFADPPEETENK